MDTITGYDDWKTTPPEEPPLCTMCEGDGKWCRACRESKEWCKCTEASRVWLRYVADEEALCGAAYAFDERWIECEGCDGLGYYEGGGE